MTKRVINFSDEINLKLQELKKELNIPMNKIILMLINEKLEDLRRVDKIFLTESTCNSALVRTKVQNEEIENIKAFETEIRFKIFQKERIFLQKQLEKTGNKSLSSEIRYRLINSIYKNRYFLPVELKEFKELTYQIRKIGININGIFRKINTNEEFKKEDSINLENSIKEVNNKINLLSNELKTILKFANNRV